MKMSAHNFCCLILGLWSGIAGIVTLSLNDKSQCAESYQTLMVLGIGLTVFSLLYFIYCLDWGGYWWAQQDSLGLLVYSFAIFVFVLDCMLIDDMTRRNLDDDCSGGRGTLRLFMIWWSVPFAVIVCTFATIPKESFSTGPQYAEFQTLMS
jgi:hypothetical protein